MKKATKILTHIPLYVWLIIFTVVPLLMIFFYAVFEVSLDGIHFTTEHLTRVITNTDYINATIRSIHYAVISTVVCLIIGYPLAYILAKLPERRRNFMSVLLLLPMWMNFLIRTYALMSLIDEDGIITKIFSTLGFGGGMLKGTDTAIIIGMVYNFLPFLILPIYTSMMKIDQRLIEAAQDLGGNNLVVFRKIIFPLTIPGVISGITMVFVPCVTSFIIPQLLNNNAWTIGKLIEYKFVSSASAESVSPDGSAISFFLMLLVFLCMSIFNLMDKDGEEGGAML